MMFVFLASIVVLATMLSVANSAAIDDYVWAPDENYGWVDMGPEYVQKGSVGNRSFTTYLLNMTSQRWLTDADFSPSSEAKSIWWHYLVVIVPDNLQFTRNASMWITGGSNNPTGSPPKITDEDIALSAALSTSTGLITGALFQIPNEHLTFAEDPIQKSRSEDAIIAYTWDHFLKDPSKPEWLVRFPMVKASLRAMDAITEFCKQKLPELNTQLDYYTIAGASKRGWTTWLVGAVDPKRVVAIVPIVLDAINFVTVEHHEYRSYGGWSYALQDYIDMNITERLDDPNMLLLSQNEDPFFFRERLTMPKLVVNTGMDEFQQPDDTHYWWSEMPGPKHFIMSPNTEHSCATGILMIVPAIGAWVQSLLYKDNTPEFDWTIDKTTGEITATVENHGIVHEANLWYAYSCGTNAFDGGKFRRDYRVAHLDNPCSCGPFVADMCINLKSLWSKVPLESEMVKGKRTYRAKMDAPEDGRWVTFFIDFKFKNDRANPVDPAAYQQLYDVMKENRDRKMKEEGKEQVSRILDNFDGFPKNFGRFLEFTTEVSVWPDTFPYPDCTGAACGSRIL